MSKISIITPFYNSEKYLSECIESVLKQDFKDFEFILINDGSNDKSLEIVKKYAQQDERIKIYSSENKGQGAQRNFALQKAKGDFILYLDSDDYLTSENGGALLKIYKKFLKDDSDIIFFNAYKFYGKVREKNKYRFIDGYYTKFQEKPFTTKEAQEILFNIGGLPFKAYKREFLVKNEIKYSSTRFIEDSEFYIKALLYADKISCLDEFLVNYRIHEDSTSFKGCKRVATIKKTFFACEKIIKNSNFNHCQSVIRSFLDNRLRQLFYYFSLVEKKYKKPYFHMLKKIAGYINDEYGLDYSENSDNMRLKEILKYPYEIYKLKQKISASKIILKNYL